MAKKSGEYKSALRFILSREFFGMKLGLENVSLFLEKMGNPHNRFPSVHIAGTNGKGSTAAYLEAIFRQAGYRTGIFTSPHLVDFRERIRVNGVLIEKRFITGFIRKNKANIIRQKITFFEVCTALAFDYFARRKVEIAIIETGLGGRLDATNVLRPLVSVISDISFDHMHILGHTLRKIAFEKAGIIKPKTPVIFGILPGEASREITTVARKRQAPLLRLYRKNFSPNIGRNFEFSYYDESKVIRKLTPSLPGEHQIKNAALSVKVALFLRTMRHKISERAIKQGLAATYWPGRFQILKKPGKPTVVLDVGHNPAGVKAMVDCFKRVFPGKKTDIVLGLVSNKDLRRSVSSLPQIARRIFIVRLNTYRSAEPEDIARHLRGKGVLVSPGVSLTTVTRRLIKEAGTDDIIVVCGSHYGVGEFLEHRKEVYGS